MKKIIYTIVVAAAMLFSGCEEFTDAGTPQTQLTGADVFTNVQTAKAALADIYARVREESVVSGTFRGTSNLLATYADEMTFYGVNPAMEAFHNHTVLPSNPNLQAIWSTAYGQIYAINAFLEGLSASEIPENETEPLRGQALFFRAYLHFYLVNMFGDIPYITVTDYQVNSTVSRIPEQEAYNMILADLDEAESLLPLRGAAEERVMIDKSVAEALLARVYLYTENWAAAATYAGRVINYPAYVIEPDVTLAFLKNSSSTIWALHPGLPNFNTKDAKIFVSSVTPPLRSMLWVGFVDSFEPGDLRRTNWIRSFSGASGTYYHSYKYKKTLNTTPSSEYTILFRIEEQYLIRAEAKAHLGDLVGGLQDLNAVRARTGLDPVVAAGQAELLQAIIDERRHEFFTEQGHRWFDLKRTGMANAVMSVVKPNWNISQLLLPLPETELVLNSNLLPQNPGY